MPEITNKIKLILASVVLLLISGLIEDLIVTTSHAPFSSTTAFILFALGIIGIAYGLIFYDDNHPQR